MYPSAIWLRLEFPVQKIRILIIPQNKLSKQQDEENIKKFKNIIINVYTNAVNDYIYDIY
jgi:hypothetical protein